MHDRVIVVRRRKKAPKEQEGLFRRGRLFYGDNLGVREHVADESVDLIYLDPPFNSKRHRHGRD